MDPLTNASRCPKCDKRLAPRREVTGALDNTVLACMECKLYGVLGDDRMFDREELDDQELEKKLQKRAVKVIQNENEAQNRYVDSAAGKIWTK